MRHGIRSAAGEVVAGPAAPIQQVAEHVASMIGLGSLVNREEDRVNHGFASLARYGVALGRVEGPDEGPRRSYAPAGPLGMLLDHAKVVFGRH